MLTQRSNKARFCKILWRKLRPRGSLLLELIHLRRWGWGWALIWVWLGGGGGGRLFEAGRLLTFSAFRMGAYSRWALIRGRALIRINTVFFEEECLLHRRCRYCLSFQIRELLSIGEKNQARRLHNGNFTNGCLKRQSLSLLFWLKGDHQKNPSSRILKLTFLRVP